MQRHRRIPRIILPIALGALVLPGAHAHAAGDALAAAINANNVTELAALATSAPTAAQRSLAEGALLALRHRDSTAIAELLPVTRSRATRTVRAQAYLVLANVYIVQQRYRDCYVAIHSALELSPHSVQFSGRQTMAFTRALRSIPPMQTLHAASGSLPLRRDRAGMIRIRVKIGSPPQEAVLDTGANFSTISTSAAKRTGVRIDKLTHLARVIFIRTGLTITPGHPTENRQTLSRRFDCHTRSRGLTARHTNTCMDTEAKAELIA